MISDKYWEFEIQQASDISLYNSPHIDGVIKNSSSIYIYSNPNRINLQFERSENIISLLIASQNILRSIDFAGRRS